jgi:hypothetical protein
MDWSIHDKAAFCGVMLKAQAQNIVRGKVVVGAAIQIVLGR